MLRGLCIVFCMCYFLLQYLSYCLLCLLMIYINNHSHSRFHLYTTFNLCLLVLWFILQTMTKKYVFQICGLAKQLDMTERQVERWWRLRRSQDKPSTLVKFCENMWRATFYLFNFSYGLFILWEKEWLWDIDQCYIGYPHQVSFFFIYFGTYKLRPVHQSVQRLYR